MNLPESINYLRRYQAWRTGKDERTFTDTGLTPEIIGSAIETLLTECQKIERIPILEKELASTRNRLTRCQIQRNNYNLQLRKELKSPPNDT